MSFQIDAFQNDAFQIDRTYLIGSIDGIALVFGLLDINRDPIELESHVDCAANASASITSKIAFVGAIGSTSVVLGDLLRQWEANSNGISSVSGTLYLQKLISARSDGSSAIETDLSKIAYQVGSSNGSSDVLSLLRVQNLELLDELEADSNGQGTVTGILWAKKTFESTVIGASSLISSMNVEGLDIGPVSSRGRARVQGTLFVIGFTSSVSVKTNPRIITRTIS